VDRSSNATPSVPPACDLHIGPLATRLAPCVDRCPVGDAVFTLGLRVSNGDAQGGEPKEGMAGGPAAADDDAARLRAARASRQSVVASAQEEAEVALPWAVEFDRLARVPQLDAAEPTPVLCSA